MSDTMITQDETEVKRECDVEGCYEEVFREGLCWEHFCEEKIEEWDAEDTERQASEEGVGYIFGDHILDTSWYGYKPEEVLA